MSGPLSGVRIVDLSAVIAGPMATQILADQGADVVKVEPPGLGDVCRYLGPQRGGMSAMFLTVNRNKRSIALNLKTPEAQEVLRDLIRTADVFVENMRPGAIERLGLTYEALKALKPDLIYVSMSGFGDEGPYKDRRVYDPVVQAVSGFCDSQKDRATGAPRLVQSIVCDKVTALTAAQAITAALFARASGKGGQRVNLNMLDSALAFLWPDAYYGLTFLGEGASVAPDFSAIYIVRPAKDGFITAIALSDEEFRAMARALGAARLADDARFKTLGARMQNSAVLTEEVGALIAQFTTAEAAARLAAEDVPFAVVNTREAALADPQVAANGIVEEYEDPNAGRLRWARPAAVFDRTPAGIRRHAPKLGENGMEILRELGRSGAEIRALAASGALGA
jgi:crotonobetainyl-CoA:carnitine CoA-transferase CaiB-like acyl-CoA transferase